MEKLKQIRWDAVAVAAICVVLGVILVIYPKSLTEMIAYAIAIGLFALAVISFYNYFKHNALIAAFRNDLVIGIAALVLGVVAIAKKGMIIDFIPLILSIVIIVSGVKKLQDALNMLRLKIDGWLPIVILSVVTIAFGVVLIFLVDGAERAIIRVIGIGLIFSGLTDAFSAIWLSSKAKKAAAAQSTSTDLIEAGSETEE